MSAEVAAFDLSLWQACLPTRSLRSNPDMYWLGECLWKTTHSSECWVISHTHNGSVEGFLVCGRLWGWPHITSYFAQDSPALKLKASHFKNLPCSPGQTGRVGHSLSPHTDSGTKVPPISGFHHPLGLWASVPGQWKKAHPLLHSFRLERTPIPFIHISWWEEVVWMSRMGNVAGQPGPLEEYRHGVGR